MRTHILPIVLITLASQLNIWADTVQFSTVVPVTALTVGSSVQQTVNLPQFDPALGTLTGVQVSVNSTLNYNSFVFNVGSAGDVTGIFGADVNLLRPDASAAVTGSASGSETTFLDSFGQYNFFGNTAGSSSAVLTGSGDLGLFTGVGSVGLTLDTAGSVLFLPDPFSIFESTDLQYSAEVVVTYEYSLPTPPPASVDLVLDIKPDSDVNSVNLKSHGVLPVAILSTANSSAQDVDVSSLLLGDPTLTGAVAPVRGALEDVNGDGLLDLVLHFSTDELVSSGAIDAASTSLQLTGQTLDGTGFSAADSVYIVPGSTKGKGK